MLDKMTRDKEQEIQQKHGLYMYFTQKEYFACRSLPNTHHDVGARLDLDLAGRLQSSCLLITIEGMYTPYSCIHQLKSSDPLSTVTSMF